MDNSNDIMNKIKDFFDNKYVVAILAIILVSYSSLAAPKLPESIQPIAEKTWFKLLIFFLIAYMINKNPYVSIIAAVAVLVSLITLNAYTKNIEGMENIINGKIDSLESGCYCSKDCICDQDIDKIYPEAPNYVKDPKDERIYEINPELRRVNLQKDTMRNDLYNKIVNERMQQLGRNLTDEELNIIKDEINSEYELEHAGDKYDEQVGSYDKYEDSYGDADLQ
jgi:hypothetical protein